MRASMAGPNGASGARSTSVARQANACIRREGELTSKHWKSGRRSSPPATSAMLPCCRNFWIRSRPISRSPASPPPLTVCRQTVAGQRTVLSTPASATMPSPPEVPPPSFRPARTPNHGSPTPQEQSPATKPCAHHAASAGRFGDPSRQHPVDAPAGQWMERLSPPKPRRNKDALCQTAGSVPHGAGLRPPGCRVPGPCGRPERLHRTWHTRH